MAAAAFVASNHSPQLYISSATIQLKLPQTVSPPTPLVYEWRTQVTTVPQAEAEAKEEVVECIKQNTNSTTTKRATPTYTPPRIRGDEAKRKNLPQTLGNFFESERYDSAWNRVTK